MNSHSTSQDQSRVPELDGLRGLAIGLVLIEHFVPHAIIPGTNALGDFLKSKISMGWSGVDLFFVLSGFLIGGILMDNRKSPHYFKAFYIRRGCRILPPYLLVLFSWLAFKFLLAAHSSQPWFQELFTNGGLPFWANLTFTQNFVQNYTHHYNPDWLNVNWTLALEEQFYLVLPLALWLLRPSHLIKLIVVYVCINPLLQCYLCIFHPLQYNFVSSIFPLRASGLLVGVCCAYWLRQDKVRAWLEQNRSHLYFLLVVFLLGLVWIAPRYPMPGFEYERILFFNLWLELFYAIVLLLAVTARGGAVSSVLRFGPLRKLGFISYSVYLFHMPINGLMHGLISGHDRRYSEFQDVLVAVASLVVIMLFAVALWRFVEKPIIAWGHAFSYNDRKVPAQ